MSYVAVCNKTGEIAGGILSNDFVALEKDVDIDPIASIVNAVSTDFRASNEVTANSHFHFHYMAVSGHHYGNGIIQQLIKHSFSEAVNNGYKCIITEATGPASQHIFEKHFGLTEINNIKYSTYEFDNSQPFQLVTEPKSLKLLMKNF